MRKVLIFGNSGSGKSTLARQLCEKERLEHLDLDSLAWLATKPPSRMPLDDSARQINDFIDRHDSWVVEGCYTDLLEIALPEANELIFMNLPVSACILNAKNRPWEPHKYESKEAQDANLEMLTDWIAQYETREDTFSKKSHAVMYESFKGMKTQYIDNERNTNTGD